MVIVCKGSKEYPDGFYMDGYLRANLDIIIRNIHKDLDFVIVISGGGEVRIGKSILSNQIGYYITFEVNRLYYGEGSIIKNKKTKSPYLSEPNTFDLRNYCFKGTELIEKGKSLGIKKFSVLIYDEAGESLSSKRILSTLTQNLLDYFREVGQFNLFNILVIPEFFDLPKSIAINRSIFLLDTYFEGEFQRGQFKFFDKKLKKKLYLKGKKELDYQLVHPSFRGRFTNTWLINEADYRVAKDEAFKGREKQLRAEDKKWIFERDMAWYILKHKFNWNAVMIKEYYESEGHFKVTEDTINSAIRKIEREKEEENLSV